MEEFTALLPSECVIISSEAFSCPEVVENMPNYQANALKKAIETRNHILSNTILYDRYTIIGDDSGLEIDALDGRPGLFSARYAGEPKNSEANRNKVLAELQHVKDPAKRSARYKCTLVMSPHGDYPKRYSGVIEGRITFTPRGVGGFCYDPIFEVLHNGKWSTFAELSPDIKNQISHRAMAIKSMLAHNNNFQEK